MRKGEKGILIAMAIILPVFVGINAYRKGLESGADKGIPFYSTASKELQDKGAKLYHELQCRDCHILWGIRNVMQAVPAPSLDGIGSLRNEEWLFTYLSSNDPQSILPSRLKAEYKMPSYSELPEKDRRTLASFLASLKVKDWYLEETRKSEYEKLTGKDLNGGAAK
jgi:sulfur-oxidizing protein SoxX